MVERRIVMDSIDWSVQDLDVCMSHTDAARTDGQIVSSESIVSGSWSRSITVWVTQCVQCRAEECVIVR